MLKKLEPPFVRAHQLVAGVAVFGATCLVAGNYIHFNPTPDYIHAVKYSSITPKLGKRRVTEDILDWFVWSNNSSN